MNPYVITCSSTVDVKKECLNNCSISFIPFHFRLDNTDYLDDLGQSMTMSQFYQALTDGAQPSTSQINISEYLDFFSALLESGKDVLHIELSSGLSGSVNSARNAAAIAAERYPDRKIFVVDSLAASSGYGLLVEDAASLRDTGATIEQVRDWVEKNKLTMHHWFFSTDLSYYVKGGRITKAAGWFGTLLNICPLLNMDIEGRLHPRSKIRGKQAVMREIVDRMELTARGGTNYDGQCHISQSHCYEDARKVADSIEARFPHLKGKVEIFDIGTTIGSHTGPGTVAVFFWGLPRAD